ncbi:MAG: hypothetical protein JWN77_835 [Frankiales bacterium]|nr:hypothetical protein [Frankiales bacterium]
MSATRRAVLALLALAAVLAVVLALVVSVWFLLPVPVLAAAMYATWLGLTPGRFADALDDGTGSAFPL